MKLLRTLVAAIILFQFGNTSLTFTIEFENSTRKELFENYDYRFEGGCSLAQHLYGRPRIYLVASDLCYLPTEEARTVEFLRFFKRILWFRNSKIRLKRERMELIEEISDSKCTDLFFPEVKDEVELFFEKIKNDDIFEAEKLFSSICEKLNTSEEELLYLK
jgi:hypothetical protein